MDQVQVDIIQSQILQAEIQRFLDSRVVRTPQLGRHEQVLSLDLTRSQSFFDTSANLLLILVAECSVDMAVSDGDCVADSTLNLVGAGLPCS